jgi:hypothetical protein
MNDFLIEIHDLTQTFMVKHRMHAYHYSDILSLFDDPGTYVAVYEIVEKKKYLVGSRYNK